MSEKIYKTYEEMNNDIGEQTGEYVFEIKQKEIDQLKAQIDKMKNCENCFHYDSYYECALNSISCSSYNKWEMMKC